MEPDAGPIRRRRLLGLLASAGAGGLAGCNRGGGDGRPSPGRDEGTRTAPAASTGEAPPSVDADVSVREGDGARVLEVTGVATAPSGVEAVVIDVGEEGRRVEADGSTEFRFDAELRVEGGRAYDVEVAVVDRGGDRSTASFATDHVPIHVEPIGTDRLVGAHYYPWYGMHSGHVNWTDRTPSEPVVGEYAADDPVVVDRHLKWCLEHGIRWLSTSWWGPGTGTDRALSEALLPAERFADVEFSILYETVGRLEEFGYDLDRPAARSRLRDDLLYLEERYFGRDNYLHLDGRPVVFFYLSGNFRGDVAAAFEAVTRDLATELYVLADLPFGSTANAYSITGVADAVTSYNPYLDRPDVEEVFHERYRQGNEVLHLGADVAEVGYVPVVIPGFNDTEIPDSQREDHPVLESSPERYAQVCHEVAPHLADAEAVLVTSFNEWYEDTQVEPSEAFGTEYLELTADRLATGPSPGFEAAGPRMRLEFDRTVVPAEVDPDNPDGRELSFMAGGLRLLDGADVRRVYDVGVPPEEPLFLGGAFGAESGGGRTWRWFGGAAAETTIQFGEDAAGADAAVLVGDPMVSHGIEADVVVDGTVTDHVAFGARGGGFDEYRLSLSP